MLLHDGAPLSFGISAAHYARQVRLDEDKAALATLGRRCLDYLRLATAQRLAVPQASSVFLRMLRPRRVPAERSFVFGIFRSNSTGDPSTDCLEGVLYFLHPPAGSITWYLTLLLLEPTARGQGLGTATHDAFTRWATARGARRTVVAVAGNNPRALHFWRERMGYRQVAGVAALSPDRSKSGNQDFELRLLPVPSARSL